MADEEESLFPEDIDELEDIDEEEEDDEDVGYKMAPYFDSKLGEFLFGGSGQIVTADGVTAWQQWCENIISTDRYNHDAYTDDIGIDYDKIFKLNDQDEIETALETEISDALSCDPYGRTQYVQSVDFEWISTTEVVVTVDVVGMDNEIITVDAMITA